MPRLSAIDAVNPAFERTKAMLGKPFRFKSWLKLGFIGWLGGGAVVAGGGFNVRAPIGPGQMPPEIWHRMPPQVHFQLAALLPKGGSVLYVQGPSENSAAKDRTAGMMETKPTNIQVTALKGQWTEESALRAVRSWLKLTTSQRAVIDLVAAQDDSMAIGARKAFQELPELDRDRWLKLPFIGCDGLPKTGQAWVRSGLLAATIFVPPNTGLAVEMLVQAILQGKLQPERAVTEPSSIPPLQELKPRQV